MGTLPVAAGDDRHKCSVPCEVAQWLTDPSFDRKSKAQRGALALLLIWAVVSSSCNLHLEASHACTTICPAGSKGHTTNRAVDIRARGGQHHLHGSPPPLCSLRAIIHHWTRRVHPTQHDRTPTTTLFPDAQGPRAGCEATKVITACSLGFFCPACRGPFCTPTTIHFAHVQGPRACDEATCFVTAQQSSFAVPAGLKTAEEWQALRARSSKQSEVPHPKRTGSPVQWPLFQRQSLCTSHLTSSPCLGAVLG